MARGMVLTSTGLPRIRTSPVILCPQDLPKMLIAVSVRPAPISPARPTMPLMIRSSPISSV
ncbi:hypothetical protein D3C86_1736540 [compost metagenome]